MPLQRKEARAALIMPLMRERKPQNQVKEQTTCFINSMENISTTNHGKLHDSSHKLDSNNMPLDFAKERFEYLEHGRI